MSLLSKVINHLPFGKKEESIEYFFALNIGEKFLTAAIWAIQDKELKILSIATSSFSSLDDIIASSDRLLDAVLGIREIEPKKILFGVPDSWLRDEGLKEEYLRLLRKFAKELELEPMAYVATSHALVHFLEKQDGVPPTCIFVGFDENFLKVLVVRAGKLDGVKVLERSEDVGLDIEKALLTFTTVETLPSKILLFGQTLQKLDKVKNDLLSFPWMSKLSFLHFPKIEIMQDEVEIKSVCLAGAQELKGEISFKEESPPKSFVEEVESETTVPLSEKPPINKEEENFGFMVGDISEQEEFREGSADEVTSGEVAPEVQTLAEDFQSESNRKEEQKKFKLSIPKIGRSLIAPWGRFQPKGFRNIFLMLGTLAAFLMLTTSYLFLPKAEVRIFVEPQILEKDAQVTADPSQKIVDEANKIIPAQEVMETVSGSMKGAATGKKEVGNPAKGTVVVYNKTYESKALSKGTVLSASNGFKFTLDTAVNIASQSATDTGIMYGRATTTVTATVIGADGNLPSGTDLTVSSNPKDLIAAKAEGNFSGGTSKEVTVVSEADQKKLLAQLSADLRRQAKLKLQEKLPDKKILEEALSEEVTRKSFSKNVNDQASEFALNLTARYKGTAFKDEDLKVIVSKLVTTQVPEGFELNLQETETQADISKLEKDGRLIFLARFRAKLLPKININKVKKQIKGKTFREANESLKNMENILGSEIKMSPKLPKILERLPILERNIKVEVGLK